MIKGTSTKKEVILIISKNEKFSDPIRSAVGKEYDLVNYPDIKKSQVAPSYIFGGCDYLCGLDECFLIFLNASLYPEASFALLRNILLPFDIKNTPFWTDWMRIHREDDPLRIKLIKLYNLGCEASLSLTIQKLIIEKKGSIFHINECSGIFPNNFTRPNKFKKEFGLGLKAFINKIRTCHALYDLMISDRSIKAIALDYGFHPLSFSRVIKQKFGECPSIIRANKTWHWVQELAQQKNVMLSIK